VGYPLAVAVAFVSGLIFGPGDTTDSSLTFDTSPHFSWKAVGATWVVLWLIITVVVVALKPNSLRFK
jgi:hypothetical protein